MSWHGNQNNFVPKYATQLSKGEIKYIGHTHLFQKCPALDKGLEVVELAERTKKHFSVLKPKPENIVNGIFCKILTILLLLLCRFLFVTAMYIQVEIFLSP